MRPTLLALDVGGVLAVDALRPLFNELEQNMGLEPGTLYPYYHEHLRDDLWSGRGSERAFFELILAYARDGDDVSRWRRELLAIMQPLPAIEKVAGWSDEVDLAILSNHRHEWLRPLLAAAGVLEAVPAERLFISSETGLIKPDVKAFALLTALRPAAEILYVDDQAQNVEAARAVGIEAIQADPHGEWTALVDARLHG